jgi:LemA protein
MDKEDYIMLPNIITIIAVTVVIVRWTISIQRKLSVLDDNVGNAMSQIGVQLSSRFVAMTALLDLLKAYDKQEYEILVEAINSKRIMITAKSTPEDVLCKERFISDALSSIAMIAERYPELKADPTYLKGMDTVEVFENMVCTSRLIYNDSVTKLNREIRTFPVSIIAGMLGFRKREYLVEQADKADAPGMKKGALWAEPGV